MEKSSTGQLLLIGIPGSDLDSATAAILRQVQPGGYILFGRNIKSADQLRKLTDDLRDVSAVEPIITIDQEGGRVSRIREIGNEPPSAQQLREAGDTRLIEWHGHLTGKLLRLFGFNLDLCPVLDICYDETADNSLKGRCYGTTVEEVCEKADIFNRCLQEEGILSCGKHFPGYSNAGIDPHHELPAINRSLEELEAEELKVFRYFNEKVDSLMIGHAHYPCFDKESLPASLSPSVIREYLVGKMKFPGLIMTDDLDMGAILNSFGLEETMQRCIDAGNHLAMICHRLTVVQEAAGYLNAMPAKTLDAALEAVAEFKKKLAPSENYSEMKFWKLDKEVWDLRVATLGEEKAQARTPEDGKRSPVETY